MALPDEEPVVVERNDKNEIVALTTSSQYAGPWTVRLYDTVMLEASGDYKFVGYIQEFIDAKAGGDDSNEGEAEEEDEDIVTLRICWFYRANDVLSRPKAKAKLQEKDLIVCKAEHSLEDQGLMKELFLSSHTDYVSCNALMHPVRVWFLKGKSLDPVIVRRGGAGPGASGSEGHVEVLPGFICRQYFDIDKHSIVPLSQLETCKKPKIPDWVLEDLDELTRRSTTKRKAFMAEWTRRCAAKMETAARRRGPAKAGATSGAE